ncbi:MAG: hypothetical protein ACSW8B_03970, partial [bacterium]
FTRLNDFFPPFFNQLWCAFKHAQAHPFLVDTVSTLILYIMVDTMSTYRFAGKSKSTHLHLIEVFHE